MTRWWPPLLHAEIRDLCGQIDDLATDRDDLAARLVAVEARLVAVGAERDDALAIRDAAVAARDAHASRADRAVASRDNHKRLHDESRRAVREAFEPHRTEQCRKLRYLTRGDAEGHAIHLLARTGDLDYLNAYPCTFVTVGAGACPPHPGYGSPWWHVGHCRPSDDGAIQVRGREAHYRCGCVWGIHQDAFVKQCREHADDGLREAS